MLAFLGALLFAPATTWAVFLDFNMDATHPAGASLSYAGGANPLIASSLGVDTVLGVQTPLNDGVVRNVVGGLLNFTTGNFTGSDANSWFFGPGGSFTVTGGVDLTNDGDVLDPQDVPAGSTLLTGPFTGTTFIFSLPFVGIKVTGGPFQDVKDPILTSFYGLGDPSILWVSGFNLSFVSGATPGSSFTVNVPNIGSGDIIDIPVIPEPMSLFLFGLGGIGALASTLKSHRRRP
jgi:hypothetical protein